MRKLSYILLASAAIFCAACSKEKNKEKDKDVPKVENYQIWYQSTDGREIVPNTIEGFGSNYLGSVYMNGSGIMYFDAPISAIPDSAFEGCTRLLSYAGANTVKSIGAHAFDGCTNLGEFSNVKNVETIGDYAFNDCQSLGGLSGLGQLAKVGAYAFCNSGVEKVEFDGTKVTEFGECAFMGCTKLAKLDARANISAIPRSFANGCESLMIIELGDAVKEVGDSAFFGCSSLINLSLGGGDVQKVGKDALSVNSDVCMIRVPFDKLDSYKKSLSFVADRLLPTSIPDDKVSQWCDYIPDKMPLLMMTIPGLHDAATWSVSKHDVDVYLEVIKDQEKAYDDAFSRGARLFDMRLGYNFYGSDYDNKCCFYHGDLTDVFCQLNTFREDIRNHFPTKADVQKSFMILVAKDENIDLPTDNAKAGVFKHFMDYLEERYDKDMFISYRPDLTYGDIKGKILLFVRNKYLIDESMCRDVYFNFLENSQVTTYMNGGPVEDPYPVHTQDEYEVDDAGEKMVYIHDGLENHKSGIFTHLFINQFNATEPTGTHKSWTISPGVNNDISTNMANGVYDNYAFGFVYMDFFWQDVLEMTTEDQTFNGEKCARAIIKHNFTQMIRDYEPGRLFPD